MSQPQPSSSRPCTPPLSASQISTLSAVGAHWRHSLRSAYTSSLPQPSTALITPENQYTITSQSTYTDSNPPLESLFMEASRSRRSQPAIEVTVKIWNNFSIAPFKSVSKDAFPGRTGLLLQDEQHPNGNYPPYQLGVSADDGVLTIHRACKYEDLADPEKRVYWSEIMFNIWKTHSNIDPSSEDGECKRLKWVAIPEVVNEDLKGVARYAYELKVLDKQKGILILDRASAEAEYVGLFNMFLGTPVIKAIQRMAVDHRDELEFITINKIFVKYGVFDYPNLGEIMLPNLLIEMKEIKI